MGTAEKIFLSFVGLSFLATVIFLIHIYWTEWQCRKESKRLEREWLEAWAELCAAAGIDPNEPEPEPEPKQASKAAEPVQTEAKPKPKPPTPQKPEQKPVKRPTDRGPRNPHRGQARTAPPDEKKPEQNLDR